jgi:hypothetical protein
MSKVKIQGNASGTGVLTVTAPNTSTDRTITLPDSTGTLLTADGDGSSLTGVGVAGISSSADATAITIDSSENVGIGNTTPESWDASATALQLGTEAALVDYSGQTWLAQNYYFDGAHKYITTDEASRYRQYGGNHSFEVAASGSADSAITWTEAMKIDNSGHVTMPNQPSIVLGGSVGGYATVNSGSVAPFNNIETQTGGSNYNTSTYRYTAPVAGWYHVTFHALSQSEIEQEWLLRKNANTIRRTFQPTDSVRCWSFSTQVYCAVNDYLDIESNTSNSNNVYMSSGGNMYSWVSYRLLG